MTSPLSRISTGNFFSGVIFEYSSLAWPGATVAEVNSILSIRPVSIAAIRTFRAKGEAGGKASFMEFPGQQTLNWIARHCERSEAIHCLRALGKMDCFVVVAPRSDAAG